MSNAQIEVTAFQRMILRLCQTKDVLAFTNPGGICILVRYNEPDEDETDLAFDICVHVPDGHEHVRRALKNNVSPCSMFSQLTEDDEEIYVIDEFVLTNVWTPNESLQQAVDLIRSMWHWRICQCSKYFIKDLDPKHTRCLFCELHRNPSNEVVSSKTCVLCCETFTDQQAACFSCCGNPVDALCYERCRSVGSCPFCRQALSTMSTPQLASPQIIPPSPVAYEG